MRGEYPDSMSERNGDVSTDDRGGSVKESSLFEEKEIITDEISIIEIDSINWITVISKDEIKDEPVIYNMGNEDISNKPINIRLLQVHCSN